MGQSDDRIGRIKESISVLEYAQNVLGLAVRKSGDRCTSLSGGNNPTAMVVFEDWWYDFKLGAGGDVIDLCACARHNGDKGAAIRELAGDRIDPHWREYTQNLCNRIAKWHEDLREADRRYLYRRGIKKDTVQRLKIGFDGSRLVIPYFKNGYVAYYVSRERSEEVKNELSKGVTKTGQIVTAPPEIVTGDDKKDGSSGQNGCPETPSQDTTDHSQDKGGVLNSSSIRIPKYKKAKLDGLNENIPWGLHSIEARGMPVDPLTVGNGAQADDTNVAFPLIITEGVFDALSFEQEGFPVLSPMGGYFSKEQLKQVLNICQHAKDGVFVCFDSDDAGSRFQTDMAKLLFRHKVHFTCGELKEKDVSDYYAAGGSLRELVDSARPGIEVLCERIEDRQEFKSFVFQAARFVGRAEMAELFEHVDFPKAWLKIVQKQALEPPPEDLIVKEIVSERRLKYFESLGFYEYSLGAWRSRGDHEIKRYISDSLGQYRTGTRTNSIFSLLKAEAVSTELFDTKPIFNFRNCVLDLETGQTHPHSETFMSSIQVPYSYDPDAYSTRWLRFVEEVTEGDERKANLLQEIAGYVLFSDNSLQKCFFLVGDGANGKSVFLDILTDVFGAENVSNVEMSGLVEPFQRIHLLTSVLNISSETQSNVKGAESVFKQIVVGDTINGCYKNKDFLTFRPRTKLVAACNEYFKSRDMTTGFLRRICFVSFNARFVDSPKKGERIADKDLTRKLREDLPAIFNWAYAGYKVLKDAKSFTVTQDQAEMKEDFMRESNPIVAFIEEGLMPGRIPREALYRDYKIWCEAAGHLPMSRTKFIRAFRQTAKQTACGIEEYVYAGVRGFSIPAPKPSCESAPDQNGVIKFPSDFSGDAPCAP